MRLGPIDLRWRPSETKDAGRADLVTTVPPSTIGWWPFIREGFAGAWQRSVTTPVQDALTHPTFWACVTLIAGDIAKLRLKLVSEDADGICTEVTNPAYSPVLTKPNEYQNRIQFLTYWIISKLTRGNAYALKQRDKRGVVSGLYLLDPLRVRPLISPGGYVFYGLQQDLLSGVTEAHTVVPASEIIHDIMFSLYHPLVGLSPVYASGHASVQGLQIMHNTTRWFQRGIQPSGILTGPGLISDVTAKRLEETWERNFSGGENVGKIAVVGDGLKFEKMSMSAVDSQLIDQLKWGDEKICSTFHVPSYMVGVGPPPNYNNIEALSQQYYSQCLQYQIESLELTLAEGLGIQPPLYLELDLDGLLRMDSAAQMESATKGVVGGVLMPNEARARFNRPKVAGGDRVYLQRQNWPLDKLGSDDPASTPPPPAPPIVQPPTTGQHTKSLCATCGGVGLLPERSMGDPVGQLPCPDCDEGDRMAQAVQAFEEFAA